MKKFSFISIALFMVLVFVMLFPSNAIAAPTMKDKSGIRVFNGKWVNERWTGPAEGGWITAQSLKIKCNPKNNICRVELIVEKSYSCTDLAGEPTGLSIMFDGPVSVEGSTITSVEMVDAYCLSEPPIWRFSGPAWFTYNIADDTLTSYFVDWVPWDRK